jgi:hypothetical protein
MRERTSHELESSRRRALDRRQRKEGARAEAQLAAVPRITKNTIQERVVVGVHDSGIYQWRCSVQYLAADSLVGVRGLQESVDSHGDGRTATGRSEHKLEVWHRRWRALGRGRRNPNLQDTT